MTDRIFSHFDIPGTVDGGPTFGTGLPVTSDFTRNDTVPMLTYTEQNDQDWRHSINVDIQFMQMPTIPTVIGRVRRADGSTRGELTVDATRILVRADGDLIGVRPNDLELRTSYRIGGDFLTGVITVEEIDR